LWTFGLQMLIGVGLIALATGFAVISTVAVCVIAAIPSVFA
jgi:hypothetical protein